MKNYKELLILILMTMLMTIFFFSSQKNKLEQNKVITKGILTVSEEELQKSDKIRLDGEWEFYWKQLIYPQDFEKIVPNDYVRVPGLWNNYVVNDEKIRGKGYATFRLLIDYKGKDRILGMELGDMGTAYDLYIDDVLVAENGQVGKNAKESIPGSQHNMAFFRIKSGITQVVIHISNYSYARGGFWNGIEIGNAHSIGTKTQWKKQITMLIFGCILLTGITHLFYFIFRPKDKPVLYFGLYCIIISFRAILTGDRLIYKILPSMNWNLLIKLEYLTVTLGPLLYYLFIRELFSDKKDKKIHKVKIAVGVVLSLLIIIFSTKVFTEMLNIISAYAFFINFLTLIIVIKAIKRKIWGAEIIVTGAFIMIAVTVYDIIAAHNSDYNGFVFPFGMVAFIFFQVFFMMGKFAESFYAVEKLTKDLYRENTYDSVTSLLKRERFISDVEKLKNPILFLIKISNIKDINENYGYKCGDMFLKYIAEKLKNMTLKYNKQIYKMDSDEFGLVIDAPFDKKKCLILGRYLHEYLSETGFIYEGKEIYVSYYTGIAFLVEIEKEDIEFRKGMELLANASIAMQSAEKNKWRYLIYEENIDNSREYKDNQYWVQKIKRAMEEDRILVHFQPIINNKTGLIDKYETLIRLDDNGSIVALGAFMEIAKKYQLYSSLTRIVIEKAFTIFEDREKEFSINISVDDISNNYTKDFILKMLKKYKNSKNVVFELLESEEIDSYEGISDFIKSVKEYGCKIAVDDFGSGYSNFSHLFRLDIDYLKIDGSLIKNIENDRNAENIVITMVAFAKKAGIKTIGEYVHSKEVHEKIKELGVDFSQGYYLGEPKEIKSNN